MPNLCLFAEISDTAIVGIVFGCLSVAGAALGSYLATRISLASLTAEVTALRDWLEKVSDGDTKCVGIINSRLEQHAEKLHDHSGRLGQLELEHAAYHGIGKKRSCDNE